MIVNVPDFALEVYLGRHEFTARHHLTASDAQTLTISELLAFGSEKDRADFEHLGLGYISTWGTRSLREAVASTYDHLDADDVLMFAGAEEAMFWAMQMFVGTGDHAIVTVPNYQSMESVTIATGAEVSGLPLWEGSGSSLKWHLDLDRLKVLIQPNTKLIAVNVPNNPTGYVPDADTWRALIELCDERGVRLFSDEAYRGVEVGNNVPLMQAADASPAAISLNVMSKAYGLPGLRIGWVACRDRAVLAKLERAKHYTSICNAGPSEFLATLALKNATKIRTRNQGIINANLGPLEAMLSKHTDLIQWWRPHGSCVAFPRYLGPEGVESFCESLVTERSAVVLPSSIYRSQLCEVPNDRFRIGFGRIGLEEGWAELDAHLEARRT
jgi:aspartate/methionine/tyrosine aminotransferase